jgi:heptosyltransferase I
VDVSAQAHVIAKNLTLLGAVGVEDMSVAFPLRVPRTDAGDAVARYGGADGVIAINPGAAWPNKRWPAERFGAVALALRARLGARTLVVWGPGEESLAAAVVAASDGAAEVSPATGTVDLFDVLRRARLLISGDTGPLHIGAAVGTPIVALFGPTRPERNGPWAAADITLSRAATCVCQYERRCRRSEPCIDDISVGEVVQAVERRMGGHV